VAFTGLDPRLGSVVGTEDLSPARPLDDLLREGRLSARQVDAAFRSLLDSVALLHRGKRRHRDLYLAHVYVDPRSPDPVAVLIDWERLGPLHGQLGPRVVKDLASIEASVPAGTVACTARARYLSHYLRARGFPVRTLLGPLMRRVVKKARRILRHVPRTPVGDAARPRAGP
jgi:hypothetical protein